MSDKAKKEFDKAFALGVGMACAILQKSHDQPTIVAEALRCCGLDRRKLKAAGMEKYDLDTLRPVFAEL